jgi:hypothetical protein
VAPDGSNQVHDFNPGITPEGVFWTVPFPKHAVHIDFNGDDDEGNDDDHGRDRADVQVKDYGILDWFNIVNSLTRQSGAGPGSSPPARTTVSFDMKWRGSHQRVHLRNDTQKFVGDYLLDTASITWSAHVAASGFTFHSTSSNSLFAVIGRERNGTFFR